MLGHDCCSHSCSHGLATLEVSCFRRVTSSCSHSNNLESDGYELLLISAYGTHSNGSIRLRHLDLLCSRYLATKLATATHRVTELLRCSS
jgi:hypothetical protein